MDQNTETKTKIINLIKRLKNISEIDESLDLIDGGFLDSFDVINLISKLEQEFKIKIEGDEIIPENLNTIDAILNLVKKKNG